MMDNRITKKRLNDHMSYDWIKYVAIVLAAVLLWSLILTMAGPKIPNNMSFSMFIITPSVNGDKLDALSTNVSLRLKPHTKNAYVQHWAPKDQATSSLIQTRFATQEGDIFIVDNYQQTGNAELDKDVNSSFNGFADQGGKEHTMVYPLEDMIKTILNPSFLIIDRDEFKERAWKERKFNKIDTDEQLTQAIADEVTRRTELQAEARELAGYLGISGGTPNTEIANLAYRYSQFAEHNLTAKEGDKLPLGEEKVWGINVGYVKDSLPLPKIDGLFNFSKEEDARKEEYAMGLIFKQANDPYCYYYIKIFNDIIREYK